MNRAQRRAEWTAAHRQTLGNSVPRTAGRTGARADLLPPNSRVPSHFSVQLHIEELILHGFSAHDRQGITDAMQQELTRLFTVFGAAMQIQGREAATIDAGTFRVAQGDGPMAVGVETANAVYEAMK